MKIQRRFTREGKDPYEGIQWVERVSEIKDSTGNTIFRQEGVVVPSSWSQIATDILAQKYFRKTGVPKEVSPTGRETDARQVFHRLAHTWRKWGERYGYFDSEKDAQAFYDEILRMLADQMAAPNSPQWFNTGLYEVYGIEGPPQGHYFVDPKTGKLKKSSNAYERPQPHACFILDVEDDLVNEGGIMDLIHREARLFKYGSGTGSNFSKIRGEHEPLSGGGVSSGLLSFLKIADRSAAAIKSGGTTRRAAKMVILDVDHPDIENFIQWKVEEEYKVAALVSGSYTIRNILRELKEALESCRKEGIGDPSTLPFVRQALQKAIQAGVPRGLLHQYLRLYAEGGDLPDPPVYTTDWTDEAYNTVSGQSSNNSVRVTKEFLEAVLEDREWELKARTSGKVMKRVKARNLWNQIVRSAWQCADPGLQFHTTVNEWHTCLQDGEIRGSNPCSEYMFLDDTACNLASLNLQAFYDPETGTFRIEDYLHAIRLWTLVLEISVVMAQFPSPSIAQKSYDYRTLGLGYANLGSLLMVMGLPYDSAEGRSVAAALTAILTGEAYATSALLAKDVGPFPRYEANKESMLRVIRNHRRAAYNEKPESYEGLTILPKGIDPEKCPTELLKAARSAWDRALEWGEQYGFRNAQVSAIAPTGTIGLLMDCDTTGIEPDYALVKYKKLAGGGVFRIVNRSLPLALKQLGYSKREIEEIVAYCVGHGRLPLEGPLSRGSLQDAGIAEEVLDGIEERVKGSFTLEDAFPPDLLSLLKDIPPEEIEQATRYSCGNLGVEGCPVLKEEHLPVFDTANPSGRGATRSISYQAHIDMMAAVQPFVSGAISKTINMPNSATVEDVSNAYLYAWRNMLKAIAIYRDGSKLSQPLTSVNNTLDPWLKALDEVSIELREGRGAQPIKNSTVVENRETPPFSRGRRPLPNRRKGYTQKAKIGGHSIFLRTGEYADGTLGEIFLDMHKEGAAFRSLLNSFAIAVSLGLQYGVPLEEYVDAFTFTRFEPNGIVQGHDSIKITTSVLDFVFRDLALTYLHRTDLVQVKPDDLRSTETVHLNGSVRPTAKSEDSMDSKSASLDSRSSRISPLGTETLVQKARMKGYEGDPCPTCGHLTLVRNGTCLKCETCGSTTGCS